MDSLSFTKRNTHNKLTKEVMERKSMGTTLSLTKNKLVLTKDGCQEDSVEEKEANLEKQIKKKKTL